MSSLKFGFGSFYQLMVSGSKGKKKEKNLGLLPLSTNTNIHTYSHSISFMCTDIWSDVKEW